MGWEGCPVFEVFQGEELTLDGGEEGENVREGVADDCEGHGLGREAVVGSE